MKSNHLPGRILITGGTGMLGRALLDLLTKKPGVQVLALSRAGKTSLARLSGIHWRTVDFSDSEELGKVFRTFRPDAVVHAAATGMKSPVPSFLEMLDINVLLPLRLLKTCSQRPGLHFVMVGTGLAYRNQSRPLQENDPLETGQPYATSKAAAEMLLRSCAPISGTRLTVLRPFSFTGPGDQGSRLFPSILRAADMGKELPLTACRQIRDFLSSRDVAAGILAALRSPPRSPAAPAIYNLGSGSALTLRQLIKDVVRRLDLKVTLRFGKKPCDPHEPRFLVANPSLASRELGWKPREDVAQAVWRLAQTSFPRLRVQEPHS